jgi:hypothetical protein
MRPTTRKTFTNHSLTLYYWYYCFGVISYSSVTQNRQIIINCFFTNYVVFKFIDDSLTKNK